MAFCTKCGTQIESGEICESCLAKAQAAPQAPAAPAAPVQPVQPMQPVYPVQPKKPAFDFKKYGKFIGIGAGALVVLIVVLAIIVSGSKKVDLKDYVNEDALTYEGVNGYGTFTYEDLIDYESLELEMRNKKVVSRNYYDYYYAIGDFFSYEFLGAENGKLNNGDEIVLTISTENQALKSNKAYKKYFTKDTYEIKYTVEGLTEPITVDVFDAVDSVTYDTTNYGKVKILIKEDYSKDYGTAGVRCVTDDDNIRIYGDDFSSFTVYVKSKSDNIDENTTSFKICTDCEADEYASYGIVLSATEKAFTPTVIKYCTDGKIDETALSTFTTKAKEYAGTNFSNHPLTKAYFYTTGDTYDQNQLAYFFKSPAGDYYYVVYFKNIKVGGGKVTNADDISASCDGWWGHTQYKSVAEYKTEKNVTGEVAITVK